MFPISIAQSNTHIPRLRQESLSCSPTPARRGDSAVLSASAHNASSPCRVVSSQKCSLSTLFSHLSSVILTQQRVPKPAGGVLKMRYNSFCVFSLVFKTCPPSPFFFIFTGAVFLIPKKTGDPDRDVI